MAKALICFRQPLTPDDEPMIFGVNVFIGKADLPNPDPQCFISFCYCLDLVKLLKSGISSIFHYRLYSRQAYIYHANGAVVV